ncbi:MAG: GH92 family glycosyl hydrolase [Myxococcota bacterium]
MKNVGIGLFVIILSLACSEERVIYNGDVAARDVYNSQDAGSELPTDANIEERLIEYVNPFIGTGGIGFGVGSMAPGASAPFSMMKLSPDTAMTNGAVPFYHCAGYYYEDEYIVGFSHNHLIGVGVTDLGNILFMPITEFSDEMVSWVRYRAPLDHSLESASPGYYSVYLKDRDINVDLTVRYRSGIHRYEYKGSKDIYGLVVDLDAASGFVRVEDEEIVIDSENNVFYGSVKSMGQFSDRYGGIKVYFYAVPDKRISEYKLYKNRKYIEGNSAKGNDIAALLTFKDAKVLNIRVGISYVDIDGAKRNLVSEIPDFNFDVYKKKTEEEWESILSFVKIKTDNKRDKRIFYTALYHLFQIPTLFTDVDRRYRGFDNQIHIAEDFTYYSDFSLWDTYRTFHPLISLLFPQIQRDMNTSLIKMYEQGGYLPRWPMGIGDSGSMVGESANIVFADSLLRGVDGWDVNKAYEAMLKTADKPKDPDSYYGGRDSIEEYISLGYVPADKSSGSVSKTQEYTYDDYAIAIVAKYLNKEEDYNRFAARSKFYKNLFKSDIKFFVAKNSDGSFISDFIPTSQSQYYVEGNAYQYRFFVPYDSAGLSDLFGGRDALFESLNELFNNSVEEFKSEPTTLLPRKYYWHSNEPCILVPFIFCDLGDCNSTNRWNRWIFKVSYKDAPDGLPGNDDGGTMSAWYIMSSLGIMTLPVKDYYLIGTPLFEESEIRVRDKIIKIKTKNYSRDKYSVRQVRFNGNPVQDFRISHSELIKGGDIEIEFE